MTEHLKWRTIDHPRTRLSVDNVEEIREVSKKINECVQHAIRLGSDGTETIRAYVTLGSPEYDFGLRVLLSSLRRHSRYPIIILATRPWNFTRDFDNVHLITVPHLSNPRYSSTRFEIRDTLTKLWIFGLLSVDRMIFMDADCLVLKSIDDLFEKEGICCAPDCIEGSEAARFNSGVMAFSPTEELRDLIYDRAYATDSYDHGDQGLLNNLIYARVKLISAEYNFTRHYSFFHGPEATLPSARVIHYIVKKPWELWYRETPDVALVALDDLWTSQLTHDELLQMVSFWRRRQFLAERPRLESRNGGGPTWASIFNNSKRFRLFVVAATGAGVLLLASLTAVVALYMMIKTR